MDCASIWTFTPFRGLKTVRGLLGSSILRALRHFFSHVHLSFALHVSPYSMFPTGYNHSGKDGQVNFLNGIMGIANAQRTLDYIRIITEFISQPEYRNVIPLFGIINEALVSTIGMDEMTSL